MLPIPQGQFFCTSSGKSLRTSPVFDAYWRFAFERQEVFFRKCAGEPPPWTCDPILSEYRFTNVYRAADRVSQFLIRHVIYEGEQTEEEVVFRILLFKFFNKIETWQLIEDQLGRPRWRNFNLSHYERVLGQALKAGAAIYSSAYIIPPPLFAVARKHSKHLLLLLEVMRTGLTKKLMSAQSLQELYLILRSIPSLGDFLAFQFAIDLNYSALFEFSEMDFVVAGPGARSGIGKAFYERGDLTDDEIIREVTLAADREFLTRGLAFRTLWGRELQLVDCQNIFCEVDKYSRVAFPNLKAEGRKRIKRRYTPLPTPTTQWYPPKWGLNTGALEQIDRY